MNYRTILVHINGSRRVGSLLPYAVQLASVFDAHLIGLHVFPDRVAKPLPPPPIEGLKWSRYEEPVHLKSIFQDMTVKGRLAGEWRAISFQRTHPARIVLTHARAVDLIVVNQADPQWDCSFLFDFPDRLAIESGRPVMVVPNEYRSAALPRSIVIAWNQSREATRALFDALPLLRGAKDIELLAIDNDTDNKLLHIDEDILPLSAVAEALGRHSINPTFTRLKATSDAVGEQICAHMNTREADLLVMGAYGHSRLRELVFGGATRYLLAHMPVPVLFSY
jgi:nucleotide-binding universal stress UspA family protein